MKYRPINSYLFTCFILLATFVPTCFAEQVFFPPVSIWYVEEVNFERVPHENHATTIKIKEGPLVRIYEYDGSLISSVLQNKGWSVDDNWIYVEGYEPSRDESKTTQTWPGLFASKDGADYIELARLNVSGSFSPITNGSGRALKIVQNNIGKSLLGFEFKLNGKLYRHWGTSNYAANEEQIREMRTIFHFSDNLNGFDITTMSPLDLQLGGKRQIFDEGEFISDRGFDRPVALKHEGLGCNTQGASTCRRILTSKEFAEEMGLSVSASVSAKLGTSDESVSVGGKFGADANYQKELNKIVSNSSYQCVRKVGGNKYAYYLDRRAIKLKPDFTRDVRNANFNVPSEAIKFIHKWGTHYPTAVIYGARAFSNTEIHKETNQTFHQYKRCLGVKGNVTGSIPIYQFEVDYSQEECGGQSKKLSSELEKEVTTWSSIGSDSTAAVEGQSSCGDEKTNVPMYLELRPIDELLGPPFEFGYDNKYKGMAEVLRKSSLLARAVDGYIKKQSKATESLISDTKVSWADPVCEGAELETEDGRVVFVLPASLVEEEFQFVPYRDAVTDVRVEDNRSDLEKVLQLNSDAVMVYEKTETTVWVFSCLSSGEWDLDKKTYGEWDAPINRFHAEPACDEKRKGPCHYYR